MKACAGLVGVPTVIWGLAILATGCTSPEGGASNTPASTSTLSSADRRTLQPVLLPDLSRMAESAREQIRQRYASLMQKIEDPRSTIAGLSDAYGETGKLFMAAEKFDAAESCYLNALALAPNDVRWAYYLGHVYRNRSEPVKAARFFERTLQSRSNDVAALVWLGDVLLAQGRPDAAEPPLTKALSLEPRLAAALFGLGRAALARHDYARAARYMEQALALDQQASIIHHPLAMAYRGLGEPRKAEAHLQQRGSTRVVFPPDPLMHELEELLATVPAYEIRGAKALDRGEWAAAAAYFRKGVELAPQNPSIRYRLGTALLMAGDALGALEHFEEAVKYDPGHVEARLKLAEVLRRSGRPKESLAHYEQVVKMHPRVAEARFGYAMALVGLRRYREARDRLAEGTQAYPDQPLFAEALARLLAAAPDDRVRDGRRALALTQELLKRQQSSDVGETLAMTLAELGQYEEAAALQRELMEAVKQAGRDDLLQVMAENLMRYESRKPCRTPWRDDRMP